MDTHAREAVTLVETFEVTGPFEQAAALIDGAVQRLEREGVPGLAAMQYYADADQRELTAVITFSDPGQMTAHMSMISGWDEFRTFMSLVKLKEMRIHGMVSPEVRAWMGQFPGAVTQYERHVAGFVRPVPG